MERLIENINKELKQISEQGVNTNNLAMLGQLVDIQKDLYEIKEKQMEDEGYGGYGRNYRDGGDYGRRYRTYNERGGRGGYGNYEYDARDGRGGYGNYNGDDPFSEHLNRIAEGVQDYEYGRDRYMHGGSSERMREGLDKMMYSICTFVETAMNLVDEPSDKEIIRKHLQKLARL